MHGVKIKIINACRIFITKISRRKTALGITHRWNNIKMRFIRTAFK